MEKELHHTPALCPNEVPLSMMESSNLGNTPSFDFPLGVTKVLSCIRHYR